jgi:nucleoside-diphosphate-sugar epimerase
VIGVTGATSGIGRALLAAARRGGVDAVALGRSSSAGERPYDLLKPVSPDSLSDLSAVIHLAWSWEEPGANVPAGLGLAESCAGQGIRPVLLSTFSAFSEASRYGIDKRLLEDRFSEVGGKSVRAGLIWGGQPAGIVATLVRLARLPFLLPKLWPDPVMWHSNESDLADVLLAAALEHDPRGVVLGASDETVSLDVLMVSLRGDRSGMALRVPTRALAAFAGLAEYAHVPLPFRRDSIAALQGEVLGADHLRALDWAPEFKGTPDLLRWASSAT